MTVLIDECLPRQVAGRFAGHKVQTVPAMGWGGNKDWQVLSNADGQFDVFVTSDKELKQLSPKHLKTAILVLPSNRLTVLQKYMGEIQAAMARIKPGEVIAVGEAPAMPQ